MPPVRVRVGRGGILDGPLPNGHVWARHGGSEGGSAELPEGVIHAKRYKPLRCRDYRSVAQPGSASALGLARAPMSFCEIGAPLIWKCDFSVWWKSSNIPNRESCPVCMDHRQ